MNPKRTDDDEQNQTPIRCCDCGERIDDDDPAARDSSPLINQCLSCYDDEAERAHRYARTGNRAALAAMRDGREEGAD